MCAVVVPCSVGRKGSPLGITAAGFRGEDTCGPYATYSYRGYSGLREKSQPGWSGIGLISDGIFWVTEGKARNPFWNTSVPLYRTKLIMLDCLRVMIMLLGTFFFKKDFIYLFLERGKVGRKKGRERSMCGCLLHTSYWGPGPQPRHVLRLGIEL